ncbi:MAG: glycosyltransferase [Chthoniobacterales bacterium]
MKKLKVLHVIPSVSPKRGGPSAALPVLVRILVEAGMDVTVATTDDDGSGARRQVPLQQAIVEKDGGTYFYFPRQFTFYTASWPLRRWVLSHVREFDIVHVHALFSFPSVIAARAARRASVPYVIRPLGVLNRWGLANRRRTLKSGSLRLIELPLIRHAAAMHYTSAREKQEAEAVNPAVALTRAAIISLAVDCDGDADEGARFYTRFPEAAGRQVLLFLSRIDPKKGIELLLEAFASLRGEFPDALLVIAGDGEVPYVRQLHAAAERLSIDQHVLWPGFLSGADKRAAFRAATMFVLPSHSENFGIAAAEALAAGVPVLLSDQVAVADDVREAGAGVVVPCDSKAIATGIRRLLTDSVTRASFSAKGQDLARARYSTQSVQAALVNLYASLTRRPHA